MNKSEIESDAVDTEPQSHDVASPINESEAKSRTAEIAAPQQQILNQITFAIPTKMISETFRDDQGYFLGRVERWVMMIR